MSYFPRASTYDIWVSPQGNDVGTGKITEPYLTIAKAFAMVTSTRKNILVLPGAYSSEASLVWPSVTDLLLTGISPDYESTMIRGSAEQEGGEDVPNEVIDIDPSAAIGAANFLAFMANCYISGDDAINGVTIDNTDMTASKKLIVTFRDCGFGADDDTDNSVYWVHSAQTDAAIKMYMHGRGLGGNNVEGLPYVDPRNAGDRCKCNGMNFEGGFQWGTTAIASEHEMTNCIFKLAAGVGGDDIQLLVATGCISKDGMTIAAAALADIAENAAETLLSFT